MKVNNIVLMRGAKPKEMPPDKGERGPPRLPGCLGRGRAKRAMVLRSKKVKLHFFFVLNFWRAFLILSLLPVLNITPVPKCCCQKTSLIIFFIIFKMGLKIKRLRGSLVLPRSQIAKIL